MNILVIEDEQKVAAFLKNGLEEQGYQVDVAYDAHTAEILVLNNDYEILLLDVIIPGMNGLQLCKKIKDIKPTQPILMLTALGTTDDKVTGFNAGADDYLVKPFEFKELLVRIKALTKRLHGVAQEKTNELILTVADLQLDLGEKIAKRDGKLISLTAKEYALLEYLMRNKGRVVSRADIAEKVWDAKFDTGTNVVEVYVNILRKKVDKGFPVKLIQTRIGFGYVIKDNA